MKKRIRILMITCTILSMAMFCLISHFLIISPINRYKADMKALSEIKETIANNFEQVYLQADYSITPSDDGLGIIVKLRKNSAGINCFYTLDKQFIKSEVIAGRIFTDKASLITLWFLSATISICLSLAIVGVAVGTAEQIQKRKQNRASKETQSAQKTAN